MAISFALVPTARVLHNINSLTCIKLNRFDIFSFCITLPLKINLVVTIDKKCFMALSSFHTSFTIEANDTVATIKTKFIKDNPLDRETKDKYTITVIATDGEGSRSTAQMIVDIKDVNDNAPKFQQIFSQISIAENQPLFENKKVFRVCYYTLLIQLLL